MTIQTLNGNIMILGIIIYVIGYILAYFLVRNFVRKYCMLEWTIEERADALFVCLGSWLTIITLIIYKALDKVEIDWDKRAKW